ncbi:LysR substrate-binding domain-containing protein [Streptomyces sp. KL2]|uniref:LysR substrate-binding domain-containing protein n=1 Tax=Streptomyces sp. KL2 TaxID=3050126 RepID=UPI00397DDFBE
MELDVRHLRVLCAIADAGSVRKAALSLGMSQPSLTTQLRRIENAIGGRLFTRERTGSRPTALGRSVLCRARPIVADMAALVSEARSAAALAGGARLRIGSTASRAVAGWVRRLRARYPGAETGIHIDVSANSLLQTVADGQVDVAFVHEPEGFPLRFPPGVEQHVLVAREPQFIALPETHPQAGRRVVDMADLADDQWIVDFTADGEWAATRRAFATAGLNPRMVHVPDNTTAAALIAGGEAVSVCQPVSQQRQGMVIRPLRGDPLAVRLLLACRSDSPLAAEAGGLCADLMAAYAEVAWASPAYRWWLLRHGSPLLPPPEGGLGPSAAELPGAPPPGRADAGGGLPDAPPEHVLAAVPGQLLAARRAAQQTTQHTAVPRVPRARG